MVTEKEQKDK